MAELIAKTTGVTAGKAEALIARGAGLALQDRTRMAATVGLLSPEQASAIADAVA